MKKGMKKLVALACIFCMLFAVMSSLSLAKELEDQYAEIKVYVDRKPATVGLKTDSTTYVPVREFCTSVSEDAEVTWDEETKTVVVEMEGLQLSASEDADYFTANDRCFYLEDGIVNVGGELFMPIRELARVLGMEIHWNMDNWTIQVETDALEPIAGGETYYNQEDLNWLSRVIYSESGNQPLEGMIAVGNVVLNRVADPVWPDTIYDVVFQPGQFDVVTYGSIYMEPSDEAVAAAKIVLEGYNVIGDCKYFINPDTCSSAWFDANCTYVETIGNHAFYA